MSILRIELRAKNYLINLTTAQSKIRNTLEFFPTNICSKDTYDMAFIAQCSPSFLLIMQSLFLPPAIQIVKKEG